LPPLFRHIVTFFAGLSVLIMLGHTVVPHTHHHGDDAGITVCQEGTSGWGLLGAILAIDLGEGHLANILDNEEAQPVPQAAPALLAFIYIVMPLLAMTCVRYQPVSPALMVAASDGFGQYRGLRAPPARR